jgi:hypothetical protein
MLNRTDSKSRFRIFSGIASATLASMSLTACTLSPETVAQRSTADICYAWAISRVGSTGPENAEVAFQELVRRQEFSNKDLVAIKTFGKPVVGMSEQAAICAWGGTYDYVNTTTTQNGATRQFVERFESGYTRYFYTRSGVVTAVQELGL